METEKNQQSAGSSDAPCSAFVVRVTRLSVVPPKDPLFSEQCTHVTIVDEAAGEYLEIEQQSGSVKVKPQAIEVTPEEWPSLKGAVETLLAEISSQNAELAVGERPRTGGLMSERTCLFPGTTTNEQLKTNDYC